MSEEAQAIFIFDWDADEQEGHIFRILKDLCLFDSKKNPIPKSSLIREELNCAGWEVFLDHTYDLKTYETHYALNVSGRFKWTGKWWSTWDYYGEWDGGWEIISLEPINKETRKAVEAYGKGWDELIKITPTGRIEVDSAPNIQNIPIHTELGDQIKVAFLD